MTERERRALLRRRPDVTSWRDAARGRAHQVRALRATSSSPAELPSPARPRSGANRSAAAFFRGDVPQLARCSPTCRRACPMARRPAGSCTSWAWAGISATGTTGWAAVKDVPAAAADPTPAATPLACSRSALTASGCVPAACSVSAAAWLRAADRRAAGERGTRFSSRPASGHPLLGQALERSRTPPRRASGSGAATDDERGARRATGAGRLVLLRFPEAAEHGVEGSHERLHVPQDLRAQDLGQPPR